MNNEPKSEVYHSTVGSFNHLEDYEEYLEKHFKETDEGYQMVSGCLVPEFDSFLRHRKDLTTSIIKGEVDLIKDSKYLCFVYVDIDNGVVGYYSKRQEDIIEEPMEVEVVYVRG